MDFATTIAQRFRSDPSAAAVEFQGVWYSRGDLARRAQRIDDLLAAAGVDLTAPVGIIVRNRMPHAAAILGLVAAKRSISMIYASRRRRRRRRRTSPDCKRRP